MEIVITILVILVLIAAFIITVYNKLIKARNKVRNEFAQIDTQMQRRFDLIPNLVEVVKGYASHEEKVLTQVTEARSGYMNAKNVEDKINADNMLSSTLKSLFAVSESYPELKANQNYVKLQEELSETEDKVTYARQFYNDTVTKYNDTLQVFPNNIVGGMFGFKEEVLFKIENDAAKQAPKVQF